MQQRHAITSLIVLAPCVATQIVAANASGQNPYSEAAGFSSNDTTQAYHMISSKTETTSPENGFENACDRGGVSNRRPKLTCIVGQSLRLSSQLVSCNQDFFYFIPWKNGHTVKDPKLVD